MDIMERLTVVFRRVFDDDDIVLTSNTTADDIDGWDSLSHVNLIVAVELAFGVRFGAKEVLEFENVGALAACLGVKLGAE